MPFRATFDCLWCGRPSTAVTEADLTGWANLCPECLDRAQDNQFLRYRLRSALQERSRGMDAGGAGAATPPDRSAVAVAVARPVDADIDREMREYYAAQAPGYDDWYLRRGRYSRGPARDIAWHAELDQVTGWLDRLPYTGDIVELAAGTGWWSPLLAQNGELSLYDASPEPLELARERLVAHRLRAHLHVRDAWAEPDRQVDGVFCGFWLSHVTDERLGAFLAIVRRWLRPGGLLGFIDSGPDPESGAVDQPAPGADSIAVRRLDDGREFRIVEVSRSADEFAAALSRAGFGDVQVSSTGRFFVMGSGVAGATADPAGMGRGADGLADGRTT